MSLGYNWFRQVWCQWNGQRTGMLEPVMGFSAGYAPSTESLLLLSSLTSFPNSGSLLDISSVGTCEKEELESISSASRGIKSKAFFLTTFILHPYLLCVIKCQLQKWYLDFYLQVK